MVHIFKPKEGLSTALVFKTLNLSKLSSAVPDNILKTYTTQGALEGTGLENNTYLLLNLLTYLFAIAGAKAGYLINDLEPPAFQCQPQLEKLKETIKSLGNGNIAGVMMSGSGTSVYALETDATSNPLPVDRVLNLFPTVRHYKCKFISKKDDVYSWYE